MEAYQTIKNPEISFDDFYSINKDYYQLKVKPVAARAGEGVIPVEPAPGLTVANSCNVINAICGNGDFETGTIDPTQWKGGYGTWGPSTQPNPFTTSFTDGFSSGALTSSAARQTIVSTGNDAVVGIPQVSPSGGNFAVRIGNRVNGNGAEYMAKTIQVTQGQTIFPFQYAVVFEDPGHLPAEQPAFSVRVFNCNGVELPNVCDLGNGSNVAISDAQNPFFQSANFGTIAYKNWSSAQINLSAYIGQTVTVVFMNKDCSLGGHFGYTYIDGLCSLCTAGCPYNITLDNATTDSCSNGKICVKYSLPVTGNTVGNVKIDLDIYQNGLKVGSTISSPALNTGNGYCFNIDPAALGLNAALGGFDYIITGRFTISGFALSPIIVGQPPAGQKPGANNDYLSTCPTGCSIAVTSQVVNASANANDGTVTLNATGGIAPYSFTLGGNTNTTGMFMNLAAGTYAYSVTDSSNICTVNGSVTVGKQSGGGGGAGSGCPKDTTIVTDSLNCMAQVTWTIPTLVFPDSIRYNGGNWAATTLKLGGIYNGHGYYESNTDYSWWDGRDLASSLAGHLVTITDAGESAFIFDKFKKVDILGPWIGIYNTGTVGSFAWVTGEPVNYTNWHPLEPNNQGGTSVFVAEPYGHIMGYDADNRWNDLPSYFSLPFIAEYEQGILTYKQVSGPAYGSYVKPGVYTVCYEVFNKATNTADTCCFNITVLCNKPGSACPGDTTILADANCKATLKWKIPAAMFPDSIAIPQGINGNGSLMLKGIYNGHGYYESNDSYSWMNASTIATSKTGHLVSITSAGENGFIFGTFPQINNLGPWIGLYKTGTPATFEWVTGEPVSYTNWHPLEPNNNNGDEVYAHIMGYDPDNRWNDLAAFYSLPFIAEFDNALMSYKQIEGPAYGTEAGVGTYRICYEITNKATNTIDTCCFVIKVTCNTTPVIAARIAQTATATTATTLTAVAEQPVIKGFGVKAAPNPSYTYFRVSVSSNNFNEPISVQVVDVLGRVVEMRNNITPNTNISIGAGYKPGMYLAKVLQGKQSVTVKLMKQ
jgi:Lectin C-type domain/Secretion system C-terminal sorting domain